MKERVVEKLLLLGYLQRARDSSVADDLAAGVVLGVGVRARWWDQARSDRHILYDEIEPLVGFLEAGFFQNGEFESAILMSEGTLKKV